MKIYGFEFENEKLAQLAKKEEEGIRYIKEHTALDNTEVVLALYRKLIAQNLFTTPVGIRFLTELQAFLYSDPGLSHDEIPQIPMASMVEKIIEIEKEDEPVSKAQKVVQKIDKTVEKKTSGNYKTAFYVTLFTTIVLAISVIGMFAIAEISKNNVNILNYREMIINEYVGWEDELKEKEDALKEWEEELKEKEASLEK